MGGRMSVCACVGGTWEGVKGLWFGGDRFIPF